MINITVTLSDGTKVYGAAIELSRHQAEAFEPIHSIDDRQLEVLLYKDSEEVVAQKIRKREVDAQDLGRQLAEHLVNAMSVNDTENGYLKGQTR